MMDVTLGAHQVFAYLLDGATADVIGPKDLPPQTQIVRFFGKPQNDKV